MADQEPIFTEYRRDILGRTCFDLLKVAVGAAFAGRFFLELTWPVKIGTVIAIGLLGVGGFFICPRRRPDNRGGS